MYFLNSARENLETVILLAKTVDPTLSMRSMHDVKSGYNRYLQTFQPPFTTIENVEPVFVRDREHTERIFALYQRHSRLNDLQQQAINFDVVPESELNWVQEATFSAIDQISKFDKDLENLTKLVINLLFTAGAQNAGGGSSSAAIGCIWLNPRRRWTKQDFCEFLVHETTHQLMFLDELRHRHYTDPESLEREENFAYSSILNKQRPLDKVLHSLVVAHEVLEFRKHFFDIDEKTFLHPATHVMEESICKTICSLRALNENIMTSRSWHLIEKIGKAYEKSRNAV
jgi:hypothetical protein